MQTLVVIGGGAAGFFCAVNAAQLNPGLQIILLEKSAKLLSKVRISGGGRCNVTHACPNVPALLKHYPRGENFLKKAFHLFSSGDTINWFAQRGVALKTEADGRMFPVTDNSQTIINCLLAAVDEFKIEVRLHSDVQNMEVTTDAATRRFKLHLGNGDKVTADAVCVACGGYPKASMFQWLEKLGHSFESPVPSLFTFNMPGNPITQLMGVSVEKAIVKITGTKLQSEGPLLITHWGMSGPAILKLSAWGARQLADVGYRFSIVVNWLSDRTEHELRREWQPIRNKHAAQKIGNRNPFGLPSRLWLHLLTQSGINEDLRWADLPAKEQNRLIANLTAGTFEVNGKTTFKDEFVTCGGVKLSEIDPMTMQSKLHEGLYFAGEIMDVDGVTGGFNFQHAWTSGYIAAKHIAERSK